MPRWPVLQDDDNEIVRLLKRIAQNTGSLDGGDTVNVTAPESAVDGTPEYFSTGANGVLLDTNDWEEIDLGLNARTVNIRFTEPIYVSFASPYDGGGRVIPLVVAESPFTIGGDGANGIDTDTIWLERPENAAADPLVHIIAYQ